MQNNKLGIRKRLIFILAGIAGQFAWCIENMYLNSYIAYLNFNAPTGQGFDYSLMIAITTALSAITATITTLFFLGGFRLEELLSIKKGKYRQLGIN